jgi:hypothetical protein
MLNWDLYGMAGYTLIDPKPYHLAATAVPAAWHMQNRLTTLSTLSSFAPPPSNRPWNMRNQDSRGTPSGLYQLV